MLDRTMLYDLIYALAATGGREEKLFGDCAPLAHEAFQRGLAGSKFPEVWFELPLLGDPWFDLHVLTSRTALGGNAPDAEIGAACDPSLFSWFAQERDGRQLALSFDVGAGARGAHPGEAGGADPRAGYGLVHARQPQAGQPRGLRRIHDRDLGADRRIGAYGKPL